MVSKLGASVEEVIVVEVKGIKPVGVAGVEVIAGKSVVGDVASVIVDVSGINVVCVTATGLVVAVDDVVAAVVVVVVAVVVVVVVVLVVVGGFSEERNRTAWFYFLPLV